MTTFDCWEVAVRPPEDYLMHFRTPGSKNGVRRYQTESGEWTPLGLKERREREGWGDGESRKERKAQKRVESAERALAKSQQRAAKKEARAQRKAARAEKKRLRSLKGLTDDEMRKKLERAKMEAEYRDLTKRTGLIEKGTELVGKYLDYKDKKEQRVLDLNRQKVDMERAKADIIKAKESTKRAKAEAQKAKEDRKTKEADVEGGLKLERKAGLIDSKREMKNYTIRGGIAKRINMMLTSGQAKKYEAMRKAEGDAEANRIKSDAERDLKLHKEAQRQKDLAPEKKREEKLRKERNRARKEYEKAMKRISSENGAARYNQRQASKAARSTARAQKRNISNLRREHNRAQQLANERERARLEYERKLKRMQNITKF